MVGLWVSPLRRGSSEGLPAALTRPRRPYCTSHFWMYPSGVHAVPSYRHVEALDHRRWVRCGGSVSIGGARPCSSPSRRLDHVGDIADSDATHTVD
jgi:hypothetical protein